MPRLGLIGILLFSALAHAADKPTLAIVGIHQSELDLEGQSRAVDNLVEAVEQTGVLDGLPAPEVASTVAGLEAVILQDGLLGEGRQHLAAGKTFYNQAEPEDAIPVLQQAIESLELGLAGSNTTRELWEAYIYLGTSHAQLGDDEAAAIAAFQQAVALDPDRPLNPSLFPPDVIALYGGAKEGLLPQAQSVQVTTDTPATVFLDGAEIGSSPVTVEGVLPGVHHVVARGDGRQAYLRMELGGSGSEAGAPPAEGVEGAESEVAQEPVVKTVALALGPPSLGEAWSSSAGRSRQTMWLYQALGRRAAGVDLLLLAGVEDDLLHLQLYVPQRDAFSRSIEVPFSGTADDEAAQAVPLLIHLLDARGRLPTDAVVALAAPLHVGTNRLLAEVLTQPKPAASGGRVRPSTPLEPGAGRKRTGKILTVGGISIGVAGIAAATVWAATSLGKREPESPDPGGGTIVVGPF